MQLMVLRVDYFRRFVQAKINLDAKVLALVGPNEAGKTSVLDALVALEADDPIERSDFTDFGAVSEEAVTQIQARYLLDATERALALRLGASESPRWMLRTKGPDGVVHTSFEPHPGRNLSLRRQVRDSTMQALANDAFAVPLDEPVTTTFKDTKGKRQEDLRSLRDRLPELIDTLDRDEVALPRAVVSDLSKLVEAAATLRPEAPADFAEFLDYLELLADSEGATPSRRLAEELERQRPPSLLFHEAERSFRSEYDRKLINHDRPEVENLLALGGSSLDEVKAAIDVGDHGRLRGLASRINENLKHEVQAAWSQSNLFPEIDLGVDHLRIHVPVPSTERGSTLIAERSEGFRAFVGLLAFTRKQAPLTAPVLLLDEAEQHLHYDAQADLVTMFYNQDVAQQIIYTTHSAGCLPHDLGSGIRAVKPELSERGADSGRSSIVHGFWQDGPGYTPLLLLMGARALAFSPSRRSLLVFGEGGTELVLVPAIFREVHEDGQDAFQVAPGLANLEYSKVWDMEVEAACVCYLVDGDAEGRKISRDLRRQGVEKHRIVSLPEGCTVEDLVRPKLLASGVNEELRRSGHGVTFTGGELPRTGRFEFIEDRCEGAGVPPPAKVNVARRVLEVHAETRTQENADAALIDPDLKGQVRELARAVQHALRPGPSQPVVDRQQ